MVQQVCGHCDGQGQVIRSPCVTCRGKGVQHGQVKETVDIPKGVDSGVNLRVSKKGNAGDGGAAGDLIIHMRVKPHPVFKRDGSNILTDLPISIADAAMGGEHVVETLTGPVKIKLPPGTQHDTQHKINNQGVTKLPPNHHNKGHHIVTVKVRVPRQLTPDMRALLVQFQILE